jgi:hypothetical protein
LFFAAKAYNWINNVAWGARMFMTQFLAFVVLTIQFLQAQLVTREFRSFECLTRYFLDLLTTIALCIHTDVAWWARTWMAQNITFVMHAMLVSRFVAVLSTTVRQH